MEQVLFDACKRKYEGIDDILWQELAEKFEIPSKENPDGDILRNRFRRAKFRKFEISEDEELKLDAEEKFKAKELYSYNDDGHIKTIASERVIAMSNEEKKDPEFVLTAHGFDPKKWIIINLINNFWQTPRPKDAGVRDLYQSKLTVKPKDEKHGISFVNVDNYFKNYKLINFSENHTPRQYKDNGLILEINLADWHVGTESLTFEEIKNRIVYLVEDIKSRTTGMVLEKIILVQTGDIMHFDNFARTTSGGTIITYGSDYPTAWDNASNLLIWVIEELSKITKLEVINIYGNHDKVSSYTIARLIEMAFKNNKNVEVDAGRDIRKFRKIGNTLVGFVHGDMPLKNIKSTLQREARKEFGETKYSEIHLGHLHHEHSIEADGVILRYLPSITSPDEYHIKNGYTGAKQGTMCFLYHKENGLRDIWFTGVG